EAGLSLTKAAAVIQPVPLRSKALTRRDPRTGRIIDAPDESPINSILVPVILTMLMLMMLMVGTSPLMQSVMEEKMQRIAEVLLVPGVLLPTAPLLALTEVIRAPGSSFALGLSLFPFATSMLMTSRLAIPPGIPWWQPAAGVVIVLATTVACVYAAGRIFRVG